MKKILLMAAAAMIGVAAQAQETFSREMPCKNDLNQVIATKMGTICLPYDAQPQDCSVYRLLSASSDEWVFQEVKSMKANTPYVFVVDNNTTLQANFIQTGDAVECDAPTGEAAGVAGAFVGTYKQKVIRGQKMYFLSYDKVNFNNGRPIIATPNRAYFTADVMPEGEALADNVKLTFLPASERTQSNGKAAVDADANVNRLHIGLQQGQYRINGQKTTVK